MGSYQMGFKHPFVGKAPSKTAKQTIKHLPCPFLPAHCAQQRGDNGETRKILLLHSRQPDFSPSLCPKTSGKHHLHPRAEELGNLLSPTPADLSPLPASPNLHKSPSTQLSPAQAQHPPAFGVPWGWSESKKKAHRAFLPFLLFLRLCALYNFYSPQHFPWKSNKQSKQNSSQGSACDLGSCPSAGHSSRIRQGTAATTANPFQPTL